MAALDLVGLAENPWRVLIDFPVSGGFLLEVCQPFHTVALGQKVDIDLALPIVQVSEAEGLYKVGDRGQQTSQVFIVIKIKDSWNYDTQFMV